jgi:metal-responsive CopG/Arc/MetJ family transcriptional regulator
MAINRDSGTRKLITLPHDLLREVDDYRFANRINTESETLRQLVRLGLDAAKGSKVTKSTKRK